jgi:hypothetical protein
MDVLLTSAYSPGRPLRALRHYSTLDRFGVHHPVEDASRADVILFLESHHYEDPNYTILRRHPLVTEYPDKVYTYNESDTPFYTLPGLYCSMPRRAFRPTAQRAFSYVAPLNEFLPSEPVTSEGDLLYSFIGAANHRVRRRIYVLDDGRGFLEDTTAFNIWHEPSPDEVRRRKEHYAEVMVRSNFVLCPRGAGTSSYRLFETMQIGRVPVVIADQWVPPRGPDWNSFIVQVAETDVSRVPELLASRESEASERGRLARAAWEQYFSPEVVFHRAVEACADLNHRRTAIERRFPCLPSVEETRVRGYLFARTTKRRLKSLASRR